MTDKGPSPIKGCARVFFAQQVVEEYLEQHRIENAYLDKRTGDVVIPLGEVTRMYNVCGSRLGICPDCRANGQDGCGKYYVYGTVRSQ